jgi:hypothetical protein
MFHETVSSVRRYLLLKVLEEFAATEKDKVVFSAEDLRKMVAEVGDTEFNAAFREFCIATKTWQFVQLTTEEFVPMYHFIRPDLKKIFCSMNELR